MGTALINRLSPIDHPSIDGANTVLEPGVAVFGIPPSSRAADSKARVTGAALKCIARFGVSKTTVDDIAREARYSRATIYRLFPGGRDEIVSSMVASQVDSFFASIASRLEGIDEISDQLVVAMVAAADLIAAHEALGFVMAYEPELVLPHLSFRELDGLLRVTSSFLAPYLMTLLKPEDARRVGEWITRLVVSHVACPGTDVSASGAAAYAAGTASLGAASESPFAIHAQPISEERARWLVETFVMPGIETLVASAR